MAGGPEIGAIVIVVAYATMPWTAGRDSALNRSAFGRGLYLAYIVQVTIGSRSSRTGATYTIGKSALPPSGFDNIRSEGVDNRNNRVRLPPNSCAEVNAAEWPEWRGPRSAARPLRLDKAQTEDAQHDNAPNGHPR